MTGTLIAPVIPSSAAARVKLSTRATAQKYRNCVAEGRQLRNVRGRRDIASNPGRYWTAMNTFACVLLEPTCAMTAASPLGSAAGNCIFT